MIPNLTREELEICARLHETTPPAKIVTFTMVGSIFRNMSNFYWSTEWNGWSYAQNGRRPFLLGTWHHHKVYVGSDEAIHTLHNKYILDYFKEEDIVFYNLMHIEKFEEFWRELDIQIAIGAI